MQQYFLHKRCRVVVGLFFALVFLVQCGGEGGAAQQGSVGSAPEESLAENVSVLELSSSSPTQITFSGLEEDAEVLLLLYNFNTSNSTQAFQLADISEEFLGLSHSESFLTTDFEEDPEILAGHANMTAEFHEMLREAESQIPEDAPLAPEPPSFVRFATAGDIQTFKVLSSFSDTSSFETVTAELRVANSKVEFYVDERDNDQFTDAELQDLLNDFTGRLDDEERIVGEWSDVNQDGKFSVLFTRVVNGFSSGGIVTGFFYAIDLFDASVYSGSNEKEIFYTFVPDPEGALGPAVSKSFAITNIYPGVLPHELQHMISYNQHVLVNGGSAEASWLNEGLAHLLEDITNLDSGDYMATAGLENPARVGAFLSNISDTCFTCGTSLSQRGGAYLFLRQLYERAQDGEFASLSGGIDSGTELVQNLLNTGDTSLTNIVNTIYGDGTDLENFKTLLGNFSLDIYFSDFDGIDLYATQNDNRGTVLDGPELTELTSFSYTNTIQGNGMIYLKLTEDVVTAEGGVLTIQLAEDSNYGGYLIQ